MNEPLSTEGDSVLVPIRCTPRIVPPKPRWNPFSEQVVFYNPQDHIIEALQLKDAPIQSMSVNNTCKVEDDEEEKEIIII